MAVLQARGLTKRFPGVVALESVDITVEAGQVHCIVGENGAGKSTLIKCLTGVIEPDEGTIVIDNGDALHNPVLFNRVAYVPQEIDLFSAMTVAENLFLPFEKHGIDNPIRQSALNEMAIPLLNRFKIDAPPGELVENISVSSQQILQCVRAIVHQGYQVLVLDEPTTSLTTADVEALFRIISDLRHEGRAIVFISHKLDEVMALADVLSVFRNGKNVAFRKKGDVDIPWIVSQMTGRSIDQNRSYSSQRVGRQPLMEVDGLSGSGFSDISFSVNAGEIVGFSGLVGSGRSEIMQTILGILPAVSGNVRIDGKPLHLGDPSRSVRSGFVYLPEDRKQQAILPTLTVRENVSVALLDDLHGILGISTRSERRLVGEIIEDFKIKTTGLDQQIRFLSGGNQQKAIIGRAMRGNPKVIVFDEPTKGIDVGTKAEIYALMQELAEEKQVSILLISSEMDEVKKCSNRIITLYNGMVTGNFDQTVPKEEIMHAIFGENIKRGVETK